MTIIYETIRVILLSVQCDTRIKMRSTHINNKRNDTFQYLNYKMYSLSFYLNNIKLFL